jgi:hypothetical protein
VRITRDARRRATPVTMTDAQRQRLLFIVTGSGLGAIGGASLVVLLRSPDMPPVGAAVSSLCGACLFGILWAFLARFGLSRPELAMSPPRRWALSSALLVFIVTVGWIVAMTPRASPDDLAQRRGLHGPCPRGQRGDRDRTGADHVRTHGRLVRSTTLRRRRSALGAVLYDGRLVTVANVAKAWVVLTLSGSRETRAMLGA